MAGITRTVERTARWAGSFVAGKAGAVVNRSRRPKAGMDDATLKSKIESIVFRPADAPKGDVDIDVNNGVVELRGVVKQPKDKVALEKAVRAIPEVSEVRNLLHLPKTPAPTRADSPGRQRRKPVGGSARTK